MYLCVCMVFVLLPTSCPSLGLNSSTTWWKRSRRRSRRGKDVGVKACISLSLHYAASWDSPCDIITWPHAGTLALMLPGAANKFASLSSKGKQPHLWIRPTQLHNMCNICRHVNREAHKHKILLLVLLSHTNGVCVVNKSQACSGAQ